MATRAERRAGATAPNWFVALPVRDPGWLEAIAPPPAGTRGFAPGDLHVTVAFLGRVGRAAAYRAYAESRYWSVGTTCARLTRVVPMGGPRRGSALSALFGDGREAIVAAIARARGPMLAAAGASPDDRDPLPHLTLARIARRATREERRRALAWAEQLPVAGLEVRLAEPALYTWAKERRERLFEIVARGEAADAAMAPPHGRSGG